MWCSSDIDRWLLECVLVLSGSTLRRRDLSNRRMNLLLMKRGPDVRPVSRVSLFLFEHAINGTTRPDHVGRDSIAVAWRERMRKAEDDYLTAAAVTTAAANSKKVTSSGLFVKVNRGVTGSGDEGRNINSVAPAADVARRGRADDRGVPQLSEKGHVSDSVGDIDAVACIGMFTCGSQKKEKYLLGSH